MQPLLQWKSLVYYSTWACVFVAFRYLACNAHAPYRHLLPAALQNVSTLYSKQNDFRKKVTEHKKCVLIFYTTFVWNVSYTTKKWARYDKIYVGLHVEYLLFFSDSNEKLNFPDRFSKILKYKISWKSVQWEPSCSMGTDERTDRHDESNTRLRNIAKALTNISLVFTFLTQSLAFVELMS